jgi:FGGY family of carbohydrate kinases, N-terminal domain
VTRWPLTPAIVWQDKRSEGVCEELRPHADALAERTGLILDPYFSAPKMTWLRRNVETGGIVTTSDTWLLQRLCGVFVTDATTASRSLLRQPGASRRHRRRRGTGWQARGRPRSGLPVGWPDARSGRTDRGGVSVAVGDARRAAAGGPCAAASSTAGVVRFVDPVSDHRGLARRQGGGEEVDSMALFAGARVPHPVGDSRRDGSSGRSGVSLG